MATKQFKLISYSSLALAVLACGSATADTINGHQVVRVDGHAYHLDNDQTAYRDGNTLYIDGQPVILAPDAIPPQTPELIPETPKTSQTPHKIPVATPPKIPTKPTESQTYESSNNNTNNSVPTHNSSVVQSTVLTPESKHENKPTISTTNSSGSTTSKHDNSVKNSNSNSNLNNTTTTKKVDETPVYTLNSLPKTGDDKKHYKLFTGIGYILTGLAIGLISLKIIKGKQNEK